MEKRRKYEIEFHKINYYRVNFSVNKKETEIIKKLESVPNKTDYIRQLIIDDIKKGN